MSNEFKRSLNRALRNQIKRLEKKVSYFKNQSKRLSGIRLVFFIIGIGIIYLTAQTGNAWAFWAVFVLFIVLFILLMSFHRQIEDASERFSILSTIKAEHLARMSLNWNELPEPKSSTSSHSHPFAEDLNITGNHSLLHLVDNTIYPGGTNRLRDWLLHPEPNLKEIRKRQAMIQELKPLIHFRDRLKLNAAVSKTHVSEKDWSMDKLLKWLRLPSETNYIMPLGVLGLLSAVNITLGILLMAGLVKPYVIFTFVLYLVIYNFNSDKVKGLFDAAYQIEKLLTRFSSVLLYLENFPFKKSSSLKSFCDIFQESDVRPSRYLKKIIRLAGAASSQKSEIIRLLLNVAVPWDLYFSYKLSTYKSDLEPRLSAWLERFYELEALNSLANFAWVNPDYSFSLPQEQPGQTPFKAEAMGHPLIPEKQKVTNDITIQKTGNILLITGSNMAGKSTFLRTMGINLCLCFAGGPVNARSFLTMPFRLFTSINVKDSLDQGLSHFYAEVKRLRELLNELNRTHPYPLFFFVDEIYKGTNNRERLIGSTAFLKKVAGRNGIGMVSTHDLELAQLEEEITELSNWHFEETIEDGKMSFEYKLKSGPCPTTNALKIMEMEGLPVR